MRLEFLVCPVRHQYLLRQALISEGLALINEQLIEENKRFYEIIHLTNNPLKIEDNLLVSVGSELWQPFTALHRCYLEKQLIHWQLTLRNTQIDTEEYLKISAILNDYQELAKHYLG